MHGFLGKPGEAVRKTWNTGRNEVTEDMPRKFFTEGSDT